MIVIQSSREEDEETEPGVKAQVVFNRNTVCSGEIPSAKIAERAGRDGRKIKQQERDSIRSLMELVYETLAATCGRWTELRLAMT